MDYGLYEFIVKLIEFIAFDAFLHLLETNSKKVHVCAVPRAPHSRFRHLRDRLGE